MKRIPMSLSLMALALLALPAHAAYIADCQKQGVGLDSLVTPAASNSRLFSNGAVAVYNIDTAEPAAASAGLAIVMPDPTDEVGGSKCVAVLGFADIDVMKAVASYDSTRGLLLVVPNSVPAEDGSGPVRALPIKLRINQKTATVVAE